MKITSDGSVRVTADRRKVGFSAVLLQTQEPHEAEERTREMPERSQIAGMGLRCSRPLRSLRVKGRDARACRPPDMNHPRSVSPWGCVLYSVREFRFAVRGRSQGPSRVFLGARGFPHSGRAALPSRRARGACCRSGVSRASGRRHETAGRFSQGGSLPVIGEAAFCRLAVA